LYCIVLYCIWIVYYCIWIVLYCIVLYCIVLYCIVISNCLIIFGSILESHTEAEKIANQIYTENNIESWVWCLRRMCVILFNSLVFLVWFCVPASEIRFICAICGWLRLLLLDLFRLSFQSAKDSDWYFFIPCFWALFIPNLEGRITFARAGSISSRQKEFSTRWKSTIWRHRLKFAAS
jgi:hypothetical protein